MIDLVASQRVGKRRPAMPLYSGPGNISDIRQYPAHRAKTGRRSTPRPGVVLVKIAALPGRFFSGVSSFFSSLAPGFSRAAGFFRDHGAARRAGTTPPLGAAPAGDSHYGTVFSAGKVFAAPAFAVEAADSAVPADGHAEAVKYFLRSLVPLLILLALGTWLFLFAGFSLPAAALSFGQLSKGQQAAREVDPAQNFETDPLLLRGMASFAGIIPDQNRDESETPGDALPLNLVEMFQWQSYTVRRGDSVEKIAREHDLSIDAIIAGNGLTNAHRLYQGQTIRIPNMDGIPYTVRRGDSLQKIAENQGVPLEAVLDANDIESDLISAGTVLFIPGAKMRREDLRRALGTFFAWPLRGRLSSPFGWRNDPISGVRRFHDAIDLPAATGTPVKAAQDGTVASRGYNSKYGNFVVISHSDGYETLYAHLNVIQVREGERVLQGTKIGEVGSTGYSTGPHLHFAVYKNQRALNPLDFLR